jgi:threonine/homoserine/homoserine lactone efflux protein
METTRLVAFLGIAVVLTISPGPDFALVTRMVFAHGRSAGWWTSLGVVTGHLTWGVAAGIGVAAVLNASAAVYALLRLAGAAYLIWLGLHALFSRGHAGEAPGAASERQGAANRRSAYHQGLANDLLNPKIGVFYTTLLPQFIAPGQPVFLTSVLLAGIFALIVAAWLGLCVVLLARASTLFRRSGVRRALERITGAVLVALGIRLAFEQR